MMTSYSYWEKEHFFTADVIVVGAGIVGLNAAINLKQAQPALQVTVLEKGILPSGASTKNAGFACFGSISELIEQEKASGTDGLHRLIAKRWNGLQKLRSVVGDRNLVFESLGGYELFKPEDEKIASECVAKISHYNKLVADIIGEKGVFGLNNDAISHFGFSGISTLIKNKQEAQIDPGAMIKALLAKASSLGVGLLTNCRVQDVHESSGEALYVQSSIGNFEAKRVLFCTNAFIPKIFPELNVIPGRGQVVITSPVHGLPFKGAFHYDKGYYYFRNVGSRVLLGGGRNLDFEAERTTEFGETERVQAALSGLLKNTILPGRDFEIEHKWSGIMAFGDAIHPIIKELKPHIFCAVRCHGMGIAIGSFTGQEAAEKVLESF